MQTTTAPGPSLYGVKARFVAVLSPIRSLLIRRGVTADTVSLAAVPVIVGVGGAMVAGTWLAPVWLVVAPLCLVWMAINAIDGAVARATATSSVRGAALNEFVDRFGDVVVIAAGLLVAPAWLVVSAGAAVAAAEGVALISWSTTGDRSLIGPMGKPDRTLVISLTAAVGVVWPTAWAAGFAVIAIGASAAAAVRVRHLFRTAAALDRTESS